MWPDSPSAWTFLRLTQLQTDGIIYKKVGDEDGRATEYGLTELGQTLAPVIDAMAAWGKFYQMQQAALA